MAKVRYHYNIMLRPEPEGGYTALVPALPGCVTYGRTVDEAREMARDAISGYIASLRKHKDPIPTDDKTLRGTDQRNIRCQQSPCPTVKSRLNT
jgi:predicted RNase H-like HicB family nuclease